MGLGLDNWSQDPVDIVEPESMTGVMGWRVEPEAMVAEPGVMGVSHRGHGVGARGYDRSYGVEPEAMV